MKSEVPTIPKAYISTTFGLKSAKGPPFEGRPRKLHLGSDVELQVIPREVVVDFPFHIPHLAFSSEDVLDVFRLQMDVDPKKGLPEIMYL